MMQRRERVIDPERCSQSMWTYATGYDRQRQCRRPATIEEQGKGWCYQHAPSKVEARRERATEHRRHRYESVWKPRSHALSMLRIIKEIAKGTVQNPQALCAAFLGEYER